MKKLMFFVSLPLLFLACSTSKESKTLKDEAVKNAVESKKFILKFDRLYASHGSIFDLVPRANYIIIDGDRAVISTAYLGRQYGARPIAAIDMRGRAETYELTSKPSKGAYDVKVKVNNGGANSFEVYINISRSGYCSASVSSLRIDNVRYTGQLVPLLEQYNAPEKAPDEMSSTI
jgi:hypothetical protein